MQRKLARQPKDSKRREITRIKIAKLHNRIADTRQDLLHKFSTKILNENQVIILEDLNVSGMVKIGSCRGQLVSKDGEDLGHFVRLSLKNLAESSE